jgi:hypothetical protein
VATVAQYVTQMRNRQDIIARKLGSDIAGADKGTRVVNLAILILLAVVIKVLVDKNLITDAELLAALNQARDDTWPEEPLEPPAGG